MTIAEITRIVAELNGKRIPTHSAVIAREIGEHEYVVRQALHAARAAGHLQKHYDRTRPFGERDTYSATYIGAKFMKESA
ncbi:MAG: hypothetical protein IAI49_06230 [Candidatus Eremiobacteraeota bacterium]|nr:hypothetical protein [Candidatus Eremiobacteraeota bacterium]